MEPTRDIDRGFSFAESLHELVQRLGPKDWSQRQREAMASHLVDEAVRFARRGAPQ